MVDPNRIEQKERSLPRNDESPRSGQVKQQPSPFDQVLQQGRVIQQQPSFQQQSGESSQQDQERETNKERRSEREKIPRQRGERDLSEQKGERIKAEQQQETGPKYRVVTKVGERQGEEGRRRGEGGNEGFHGQGGQGPQGRLRLRAERTAYERADIGRDLSSRFQRELLQQHKVPAALDRGQLQRVVNLLVQSIRLGKNEVGAEELAIVFHASIFKGLRLRLQSKDGKVTIDCESAESDVRALFLREQGRIRAALERKGVVVAQIRVV
ncbi:MAG: hypothetical protein HYV02_02450 [Deltaproteobacteria bacterium]|nr:hypothetical protein [Deltaproteobacteria bacterium]